MGGMKSLELLLTKLGNVEAVCRRLWISRDELRDYLSGLRPVPQSVSLHALDLLGAGRCH
jgi:hypothetical protein